MAAPDPQHPLDADATGEFSLDADESGGIPLDADTSLEDPTGEPNGTLPGETSRTATGEDGGTVRVRIDLGYAGGDFAGWASQPGRRTVQAELEGAIALVTRHPVRVKVAGRTDAGVHAREQVVHLDLPRATFDRMPGRSDRTPEESLMDRLTGVLPTDIVVHRIRPVTDDFEARFGALWRRYRYRIADGPEVQNPTRTDVLRLRRPLDLSAMARASERLVGEHDFLSFCRPRVGASTIRTLQELSWTRPAAGRVDEGLVVATVKADAFCHHMVRSLVGTMLIVGSGRRGEEWPAQVLAARTRMAARRHGVGAAPLAPAIGLTLEHVEYPPDHLLAERAASVQRLREAPAT